LSHLKSDFLSRKRFRYQVKFRNFFNRFIFAAGSPYGCLLLTLLATLIVYPFLGSHRFMGWVLDIVMLGLVASALRVIHGKGFVFNSVWILGVSAFLLSLLGRSMEIELTYPIVAGLRAFLMCYLIVIIFSDCMRQEEVTFNTVFGASCVYFLLGLAFASIYVLLEWFASGAFYIPAFPTQTGAELGRSSTEFNLAYFSFVAMTTVGFGDIVPVAPLARGMAALEGMLGQLYLTIIIARLVGLEIANRLEKSAARNGKSVIKNSDNHTPDA